MPIQEHPAIGAILLCNFDSGFKIPEMVKRRPVVVISPKIASRAGLCTVVALSTHEPRPRMSYHCEINLDQVLPPPFDNNTMWVKGDMLYAVAFHRLDYFRSGRDSIGRRIYITKYLNKDQLKQVRECVLRSIGLGTLTKHL